MRGGICGSLDYTAWSYFFMKNECPQIRTVFSLSEIFLELRFSYITQADTNIYLQSL